MRPRRTTEHEKLKVGLFHWRFGGWLLELPHPFRHRFFPNGLEQTVMWMHTGHLARPDIFIAVPAWFSNLLVICGCVWAYSRLGKRRLSDVWGFVSVFVLTTGFLALDMALFQARYLAIFPRLLHPHLP